MFPNKTSTTGLQINEYCPPIQVTEVTPDSVLTTPWRSKEGKGGDRVRPGPISAGTGRPTVPILERGVEDRCPPERGIDVGSGYQRKRQEFPKSLIGQERVGAYLVYNN